jgi:hypothetical protein
VVEAAGSTPVAQIVGKVLDIRFSKPISGAFHFLEARQTIPKYGKILPSSKEVLKNLGLYHSYPGSVYANLKTCQKSPLF